MKSNNLSKYVEISFRKHHIKWGNYTQSLLQIIENEMDIWNSLSVIYFNRTITWLLEAYCLYTSWIRLLFSVLLLLFFSNSKLEYSALSRGWVWGLGTPTGTLFMAGKKIVYTVYDEWRAHSQYCRESVTNKEMVCSEFASKNIFMILGSKLK